MFNAECFEEMLELYKQDFYPLVWVENDEGFKWRAVKCFQNHWDIDTPDFANMLDSSLAETSVLLSGSHRYPMNTIIEFSKAHPEEIRSIFKNLYDEEKDLIERIHEFKKQATVLQKKYGKNGEQHFQDENAITTYLWLKYPDKYYIYKYNVVKTVAEILEGDYSFKKGSYDNNLENFFEFYNEICSALKQNNELIEIVQSHLDEQCYDDPQCKTLTIDFCFYLYQKNKEPGKIENAPEVSEHVSNEKDVPGHRSNDSYVFNNYNALHSNARMKKWMNPIVNTLRELGGSAEIGEVHNRIIEDYEISDEELATLNKSKTSKVINDIDWARNYLRMEGILANNSPRGIWTLTQLGERINISDRLSEMIVAKCVRVNTAIRENKPIPIIDLTPYYKYIDDIDLSAGSYSEEDFLNEVYIDQEQYKTLKRLLENKKNVILQGAPGVGKTFAAKRIAYSMMGKKDDSRIAMIQFHPNYSYEDFIIGYRPDGDSFKLTQGVFYKFCVMAGNHPDKQYFFIIDEINRGNLSKIFGELMMLIENRYRGESIILPYSGTPFSIPENLYIIGMMNTADRSLAMIDYALRRRFSFFEMSPAFEQKKFKEYQKYLDNETFNKLIDRIKRLNMEIENDSSLGGGFRIGHSYFCDQKKEDCTAEWMRSIVDYEILPMLSEYWFDDHAKLQKWRNSLHEAIK